MINVLVIMLECVTTWLCLHAAFGEKIRKSWGEIVYFVFYVSIFTMCSYGILSKMLYIVFVLFVFIWCKLLFGNTNVQTLIMSIIGVFLIGIIEVIVVIISSVFLAYVKGIETRCLVATFITMCLAIIIWRFTLNRDRLNIKTLYAKNVFLYGFLVIVFLYYVKFQFEEKRTIDIIHIIFFLLLTLAFIFIGQKQKAIFKLENENLKLELESMYGTAYEELLEQVRRRQHDYKNQISALYSMQLTATSLDELVKMQSEYVDILAKESKFDSVLTKCNNPILAGYIYNVCLKYEKLGFDMRVETIINNNEINVKTKDVIEILGVLVTNAAENQNENMEKKMILKVSDDRNKIKIEVSNLAKYKTVNDIENMFKYGFSTKGENRGIGLDCVKRLVHKYDGDLFVQNTSFEKENWLEFRIEI